MQQILWYEEQFNLNSGSNRQFQCLNIDEYREEWGMSIFGCFSSGQHVCDWHQISNVHYFWPGRSIIFDFVQQFLQRSCTPQRLFLHLPHHEVQESFSVSAASILAKYVIARQCSFWSLRLIFVIDLEF